MKERAPETQRIMDNKNRDRRAEAELRKAMRSELSPAEQIRALDARLGFCIGAKRERARLL